MKLITEPQRLSKRMAIKKDAKIKTNIMIPKKEIIESALENPERIKSANLVITNVIPVGVTVTAAPRPTVKGQDTFGLRTRNLIGALSHPMVDHY